MELTLNNRLYRITYLPYLVVSNVQVKLGGDNWRSVPFKGQTWLDVEDEADRLDYRFAAGAEFAAEAVACVRITEDEGMVWIGWNLDRLVESALLQLSRLDEIS